MLSAHTAAMFHGLPRQRRSISSTPISSAYCMKSFLTKYTRKPQNSGDSTIHQFMSRFTNAFRKNVTTNARQIIEIPNISGNGEIPVACDMS